MANVKQAGKMWETSSTECKIMNAEKWAFELLNEKIGTRITAHIKYNFPRDLYTVTVFVAFRCRL